MSSQLDLSQLPLSDAIERNVIVVRDSDLTDIFQIANLGIVGDVMEVVPALTEGFKKKLGN